VDRVRPSGGLAPLQRSMNRPSRIAKRLLVPAIFVAALVVVGVVLAAPPQPNFTVSDQQAGGCGTFTFTDTSTDGDLVSDLLSVQWDFGDGTTASGLPGSSVTHSYATANPAQHTVTLTATDADTDALDPADGPDSVPIPKTVTIANTAPTASFPAPANAQLGQVITVQGTGADADGIQGYAWEADGSGGFDDGATAALTLDYTQPTATPGLKALALRVTDACGIATTTPSQTYNVINPRPHASFQLASNAISAGQPVQITSTSTDQAGGSIASYQWDLNNDGAYNEGGATGEVDAATVTTSFASGFAPIRLIVTDNNGETDDEVGGVAVSALPFPTAGYTWSPASPLPGQRITLTSISRPSTAANAPPLAGVEWDFDYSASRGFQPDATGNQVTHSFATAGAKTVAIRAIDAANGSSTTPDTIVVNAPPSASFTTSPGRPTEGREVTFASTATDPDGPIVKQEWDLDGDSSYDDAQGAVATTAKLKKGKRAVRLRVTDSKGAVSSVVKSIQVRARPLKAPVDVKRSLGYIREPWGAKLVVLIVRVPSKTTVTVSCKGRGCPTQKMRKRSRKRPATLNFAGVKASVRAGAKLTVVTTRPGHTPAYDVYTIRGNKQRPVIREGCKPPGAKKVRPLSRC
jgi:PKD domain